MDGSQWTGTSHNTTIAHLWIDGACRYEFAANEFVSCVVSVPLETMSTESGMKDFIAVGTTINRGEDLAAKGAVSSPLCVISGVLNSQPDVHLRDRRGRRGPNGGTETVVQTASAVQG